MFVKKSKKTTDFDVTEAIDGALSLCVIFTTCEDAQDAKDTLHSPFNEESLTDLSLAPLAPISALPSTSVLRTSFESSVQKWSRN